MRKESIVARSNWEARQLSSAQISYAADDAYFTFRLLGILENLPDGVQSESRADAAAPEGSEKPTFEVVTAFSLKPGWVEMGVKRTGTSWENIWQAKGTSRKLVLVWTRTQRARARLQAVQ